MVALDRRDDATRLLLDLIPEARSPITVAQLHIVLVRNGLDAEVDHAGTARRILADERNGGNAELIEEILGDLNDSVLKSAGELRAESA
jgi:hypothetical protein